jgi:hypothetical protein
MAQMQNSLRKKRGYASSQSIWPVLAGLLWVAGCTSVGPGTIDRDRLSKIHFTFLMVLFSLTETGTPPQAPLITVPIN